MVLAMLCACTPQSQQSEAVEELKVLSWNVWHGGHSEAYPGKSCEGTMGILKKSEADVILMVETYGCSDQVADH
ncbi:endonuclease/exonuclease/phosphatase family protein, partial [Parabacteroides goldsteinii]|uniref:endonuclease/exonuclease/phosphatase family protein n=2 Tax=Tannerellaceae TaxID=2005525 RepID=UPI0026DCD010